MEEFEKLKKSAISNLTSLGMTKSKIDIIILMIDNAYQMGQIKQLKKQFNESK